MHMPAIGPAIPIAVPVEIFTSAKLRLRERCLPVRMAAAAANTAVAALVASIAAVVPAASTVSAAAVATAADIGAIAVAGIGRSFHSSEDRNPDQ